MSMGRQGPESRLIDRMRKRADIWYGDRLVWVKYHGGPYTAAGVPDLLLCLDGVYVAAEVKAPDHYGNSVEKAVATGATIKQRAFIDRVRKAGGVAGVVADEDGLLRLLEEAERVSGNRD